MSFIRAAKCYVGFMILTASTMAVVMVVIMLSGESFAFVSALFKFSMLIATVFFIPSYITMEISALLQDRSPRRQLWKLIPIGATIGVLQFFYWVNAIELLTGSPPFQYSPWGYRIFLTLALAAGVGFITNPNPRKSQRVGTNQRT